MSIRTGALEAPEACALEVRALIESMRRNAYPPGERRCGRRHSYRVEAQLWYRQGDQIHSTKVHTRDAKPDTVAFITSEFFYSGQSVILDLPEAAAQAIDASMPRGRVHGHIRRCRHFREGWVDCVMQLRPAEAPPSKPLPRS